MKRLIITLVFVILASCAPKPVNLCVDGTIPVNVTGEHLGRMVEVKFDQSLPVMTWYVDESRVIPCRLP